MRLRRKQYPLHEQAARPDGGIAEGAAFKRRVFATLLRVLNMYGDVIPPFDEPSPVLFLWCHPPPVDSTELGLDPKDMCFCCSFTSLFQRLGGVLNESVPVGLPHGYNRDVHPSCLRHLEAVLATERPDPPCVAIKPALLSNCPFRLLPLVPVRYWINLRPQPRLW